MKLTSTQQHELNRLAENELAVGALFTGSTERTWLQDKGLVTIDVRPGIGKFWTLTSLGKRTLNKHTIIGEGEV